jgi:hypothetical protein
VRKVKDFDIDEIPVLKGRYPYQSFRIKDSGKFREIIKEMRTRIERNPSIFDEIVDRFFDLKYPPFKYTMTKIDKERDVLIFRYFSLFDEPYVYAGVMIQFVYFLKTKKVEKIYVDLVPLE